MSHDIYEPPVAPVSDSHGPLGGERLYSPGAVAAYSLFGGLPLGVLLYGLNVKRRGASVMGAILCTVAGLSYLLVILAAASGASVSQYGLLGVLGALGLYKWEAESYRQALRKGAVKARWWPPALLAVCAWVVLAVVIVLTRPESQIQ